MLTFAQVWTIKPKRDNQRRYFSKGGRVRLEQVVRESQVVQRSNNLNDLKRELNRISDRGQQV